MSPPRAFLFEFRTRYFRCPYYDPKLMGSTRSFTIQPQEQVLVVFTTRDTLYRYRTCCQTMSGLRHEQLCVLLRNCSPTEPVPVREGDALSQVMDLPCMTAQLLVGGVDTVTKLLIQQCRQEDGDEIDTVSRFGQMCL